MLAPLRFFALLLICAAACAGEPTPTAAPVSLPEPTLKPSLTLTPFQPAADARLPSFVRAERIDGETDYQMQATGDAWMRKHGAHINARTLTYAHIEDEVTAEGAVRLQHNQDIFTGPKLRLRVEDNIGFFEQPSYWLPRDAAVEQGTLLGLDTPVNPTTRTVTGSGAAERVDFLGEGLFRLIKGSYSTCKPGDPAWYVAASELTLDYNRNLAEGSDGRLVFYGMPLLYSPWLSFPLEDKRRSGFLVPTLGSTNTSGLEITAPWYWNIAPNMDATVSPRLMLKRGLQLNTELRYLDPKYSGTSTLDVLPQDRLVPGITRFAYSVNHAQTLPYGFSAAVNLNGVSDNAYNSDLTGPGAVAAQNSQVRQMSLAYSAGWWSAGLLMQRYQVIEDPALPPPAEPYRRLPQLTLTANRFDLPRNAAFNFSGEYVNFVNSAKTLPSGQRTTLFPQLSLPLQTASVQVTPKLGLHFTRYALDTQAGSATPAAQTVAVPIFSVDSALTFERDIQWAGRAMTQTLEPRLFYVHIPYRDQSQVPVFDTGLTDFNFAQIFTENRYAGNDRVGDANQLTTTLTSRLVDPQSGGEWARAAVGQRFYFQDQQVTLPGETPRSGKSTDLLLAASGLVLPRVYADTGWQYDQDNHRTNRASVALRYQPEIGKVLNAGYSYTRDVLAQYDVSAQWPLGGGVTVVGRYNYSLKDKRMVESVGGLEYDAGCWIGRVVLQSVATQTEKNTVSLLFQVEFNGFSRLGWSNPVSLLKRSVPGYWRPNMISPDNAAAP